VSIETFDPHTAADGDLIAWCTVYCDGRRALSGGAPAPESLAAALRAETAALRAETGAVRAETGAVPRWLARHGPAGPVVGAAEVRGDFLHLAVAARARGAGIGAALLAGVRAGTGGVPLRTTVLEGDDEIPHGEVLLRLQLHEQPLTEAVLRRCRDLTATVPPGYGVLAWRGAAPDELAASLGRVLGHVLDAPGADLQLAPRAWDTAAVRRWEQAMTAGGDDLLVCVAEQDGTVVAATALATGGGAVAEQHDTAVLPGRRRLGLGRLVKAANTLALHRLHPATRAVAVTVNEANLPMLAVNRAVGYTWRRTRLLVQL
jgi:GNAT superfamily N-acetyltransferase